MILFDEDDVDTAINVKRILLNWYLIPVVTLKDNYTLISTYYN